MQAKIVIFCILFPGLASTRGVSGSLESLGSMGADSVITGTENANGEGGPPAEKPSYLPQPRSPLQSSSSLELSPRMEQVISYSEALVIQKFSDCYYITVLCCLRQVGYWLD